MNPAFAIETLFAALARAGGQAAILGLLVLGTQFLFRKKLLPMWRYLLWAPVVLRLLFPALPESSWSLFNLTPQILPPLKTVENVVPNHLAPSELRGLIIEGEQLSVVPVSPEPAQLLILPASGFSLLKLISCCSLAGALLFVFCFSFGTWRLSRRIKLEGQPVGTDAEELFQETKALFGLDRGVPLRQTAEVDSPALFGLFRPILLLPPALVDTLSRDELRHVFAHECAHLKRRDLWSNALLVLLQVIHWWNPFVWLFFARIRADRELACDHLALAHLNPGAAQDYGRTLLRLLEGIVAGRRTPLLVGILEEKSQLKERVRAIAGFRAGRRFSWLAASLLGVLVATGLSDAQRQVQPSSESAIPPLERTKAALPGAHSPASLDNPLTNFPWFPGHTLISDREGAVKRRIQNLQETQERLDRIILPSFGVPDEFPLPKILLYLRDLAREHDSNRIGVQFQISSTNPTATSTILRPSDYVVKIDPPLVNLSLREALQAVLNAARPPSPLDGSAQRLGYTVDDGWIYISAYSKAIDQNLHLPPSTALRDARLLVELGNVQEAALKLSDALAHDPDNTELQDYLSRINDRLRAEKALKEKVVAATAHIKNEPLSGGTFTFTPSPNLITLEVTAAGDYLIEGRQISLEQTKAELIKRLEANPKLKFAFHASEKAPFEQVQTLQRLIDECQIHHVMLDREKDKATIEITSDGNYKISGTSANIEELEKELSGKKAVHIWAAKKAPSSTVTKLLELCGKIGITNVSASTSAALPPPDSEKADASERQQEGRSTLREDPADHFAYKQRVDQEFLQDLLDLKLPSISFNNANLKEALIMVENQVQVQLGRKIPRIFRLQTTLSREDIQKQFQDRAVAVNAVGYIEQELRTAGTFAEQVKVKNGDIGGMKLRDALDKIVEGADQPIGYSAQNGFVFFQKQGGKPARGLPTPEKELRKSAFEFLKQGKADEAKRILSPLPDADAVFKEVEEKVRQDRIERGELPVATQPEAAAGPVNQGDVVTIEVSPEGDYMINSEMFTFPELERAFPPRFRNEQKQVSIRANAKTPYSHIVRLIDLCRINNVQNVTFETMSAEGWDIGSRPRQILPPTDHEKIVSGREQRILAESARSTTEPPFVNSIRDARLLMEMGKLDEAESKLKEVLKEHPEHRAATYYLTLLQEHRYSSALKRERFPIPQELHAGYRGYNPYASNPPGTQKAEVLLVQVNAAGECIVDGRSITLAELRTELDRRVKLNPGLNVEFRPDKEAPATSVAQVQGVLEGADLKTAKPEPPKNSEKTIESQDREALRKKLHSILIPEFAMPQNRKLVDVVRDLDLLARNSGQIINFIISTAVNSRSVDPVTGKPLVLDADAAAAEDYLVKIDPPLKSITLTDIVLVVAAVAHPPPGKTGGKLNVSVEDYAVVFSNTPQQEPLYTRTFKLDPSKVPQTVNGGEPLEQALVKLFTNAGVDFGTNALSFSAETGPPPQKALFFKNDHTGLVVRATRSDLDKIESVLQKLQVASPTPENLPFDPNQVPPQ